MEGSEEEMVFNQGKSSKEKGEDKKKVGRRSITKAKEVSRKTSVVGLGDNKKGVSDVYKEYYEEENKSNGIFYFRRSKVDGGDNKNCNIHMDQVKEIGELIGVSWVRTNDEERSDRGAEECKEVGAGDNMSIIKEERPDVIGLQETKSRMVDEMWVEDIWGGQSYGFAQLPAIGNSGVVALDRKLSDHCPIVLKDMELEFGPKPFRIFNMWMEEPDFYKMVGEAWGKEVRSARPDCIFRDRLKNVKASLRVWSKEKFGGHREKIESLKNEAMKWELEAEKRVLTESERSSWLDARKQWEVKDREYGNMLRQKDRIKWDIKEDNKVPLILGRPFLHTADAVIRVKQKQLNLGVGTERMIFNIDSAMKHSYSNDDTCFSIDVIDEILEEDFDTLLDEGSKILHSIEGTLLEKKNSFLNSENHGKWLPRMKF
ncbi:reverse transcriptase domain-containing protein [Tanacetum coccineum]|uniref:Reverse transcriptase domain-containing protein n=1 Tax=Tanacetum coccineum TaxID=301880 RepID=A0ABQ5BXD9_9ASTR